MMELRSNAGHYWTWAGQNAAKYLPPEVLAEKGWLVGDPHHENFSYVFIEGRRDYVPDDLDDAGYGPFILDFLKFLGVSRAVSENKNDLSVETAFTFYLAGLKGEKWNGTVPALLLEDFSVTPKELEEAYLKRIKKKVKGGEFEAHEGMTAWQDMTSAQKDQFNDFEKRYFKKYIPAKYEVKDRAMFTKVGRGGSAGKARFWYYLKASDVDRQFIEFKEMEGSSLANYQAQPGTTLERVHEALKIYWGEKMPELFGVVGDAQHAFWMRPKLPLYIDFNRSFFKKNIKDFTELSYFISYKLGQWHGRQMKSAAYCKNLEANFKKLAASMDQFTSDYLEVAAALMQNQK